MEPRGPFTDGRASVFSTISVVVYDLRRVRHSSEEEFDELSTRVRSRAKAAPTGERLRDAATPTADSERSASLHFGLGRLFTATCRGLLRGGSVACLRFPIVSGCALLARRRRAARREPLERVAVPPRPVGKAHGGGERGSDPEEIACDLKVLLNVSDDPPDDLLAGRIRALGGTCQD
jgi:hypothetical protein